MKKTFPSRARLRKKSALPAYQNPALATERRVRDLLARMTLAEKAAQMMCIWRKIPESLADAMGRFDLAKARRAFRKGEGLGQVGRPSFTAGGLGPRAMAEFTNAVQKFFRENSPLGIPVLFHEECLHGLMAPGATHFPQPIALASTFNPELVEALFTMTAAEARARGVHQALSPVVDVAREPRWGRVEETYGEDPYLVAQMGIAAVRGFQGDNEFRGKTRIIATLKHFAAHGQPESGTNCAPANISERTLRDTHLFPFKEAIQKAGVISVMPSYNEIDGVPSHANLWLLREVLRKEWGFRGFLVSDYFALWELADRPATHGHHLAKNKKESCALAVRAGVNIELPDPDCYFHLVELVHTGVLKESQLDELIAPMLYWKFKMGLFDDPYIDPAEAERLAGCDQHRALARRAAREAITLLKNDGALLPLNEKKIQTLAVIGPNAHRSLLGGYSSVPKHGVTVLDGLRARLGNKVKILHAEGCKITVGGSWAQDTVTPGDPAEDRRKIARAVAIARKANVVILALGGNEQTSREAWSRQHLGDRANLDLIGRQDELARALLATGKPVVVLLFHGRPNSINFIAAHAPAILECWYLGQECGHAVAEVLFGDFNPGGKLPISIPRSAGHLPAYYNYKPSARRGYLFDDISPLYPFGHGLSFTTFAFSHIRLAHKKIRRHESVRLFVDVTNTGKLLGSEVVQMYVRDRVSSVTRPMKELKGFHKVVLAPGETKTVTLEISSVTLAFHDVNMKFTVEPGEFDIMVGSSSRDEDLQKVVLTVV